MQVNFCGMPFIYKQTKMNKLIIVNTVSSSLHYMKDFYKDSPNKIELVKSTLPVWRKNVWLIVVSVDCRWSRFFFCMKKIILSQNKQLKSISNFKRFQLTTIDLHYSHEHSPIWMKMCLSSTMYSIKKRSHRTVTRES